jgi:hypothetical protein
VVNFDFENDDDNGKLLQRAGRRDARPCVSTVARIKRPRFSTTKRFRFWGHRISSIFQKQNKKKRLAGYYPTKR